MKNTIIKTDWIQDLYYDEFVNNKSRKPSKIKKVRRDRDEDYDKKR